MRKIFTEKQISMSAFLGGPIPAGFMIFKNCLRLHKEREAYISLAITLIFTIVLIFVSFNLPDDFSSNSATRLLPSLVGLVMWGIYSIALSKEIKTIVDINKESNWKVAGITILGIVVYLMVVIVLAFTQPPFQGEKIAYGENEIYYERTSKDEIAILSRQLFEIGYFSEEYPNSVKFEKKLGTYKIIIPLVRDLWDDQQLISQLTSMKWLLEVEYGKEVFIVLEEYDLSGKRHIKMF